MGIKNRAYVATFRLTADLPFPCLYTMPVTGDALLYRARPVSVCRMLGVVTHAAFPPDSRLGANRAGKCHKGRASPTGVRSPQRRKFLALPARHGFSEDALTA